MPSQRGTSPGSKGTGTGKGSSSAKLRGDDVLERINNAAAASMKLGKRDAFFQFLYLLIKQTTIWKPKTVLVVFLRFVVDILIAFQAAFDNDIAWGANVGDGVRDFFYYLTYPAVWLRREWFIPMFIVVALTMSLLSVAAVLTVRAFHKGHIVPVWLLKLIISLHAIITTLYMPMLQTAVIPLNCAQLNRHSQIVDTCWGWPGITLPMISIVLICLFMPYTITMGFMYWDARPDKRRPLAMSNGRVEATYILSRMAIILVFVLGSCETGATCVVAPKVIVLLLIALLMLCATGLMQPFLNGRVNHARCAIFSLLLWTTLCALVSVWVDDRTNNTPGYIWIGGIFPSLAFGWFFSKKNESRMHRVGKGIAAGTSAYKFKFLAEVDLAIRGLGSSTDRDKVVRYAMLQYPRSAYLPAMLANTLSVRQATDANDFVDENPLLTLQEIEHINSLLQEASAMTAPLDVKFLEYTVKRRIQMNSMQTVGMHRMGSQEALLRMSLQGDMVEARRNHEASVRTLINFWKGLLVDEVELERLPEEGQRLHEASSKADTSYKRLLAHYREDAALHHSYASFLETVLLDEAKAEYYRSLVNQDAMDDDGRDHQDLRSLEDRLHAKGPSGHGTSASSGSGSKSKPSRTTGDDRSGPRASSYTSTNFQRFGRGNTTANQSSAITRLLINIRIAFVVLLALMVLSFAQKEAQQSQEGALISIMDNGESLRTASQAICVDVLKLSQEAGMPSGVQNTTRGTLQLDIKSLDAARFAQFIAVNNTTPSRYEGQDKINRLPSVNIVEMFETTPKFFRQKVYNMWDALGLLMMNAERVLDMPESEIASSRELSFVLQNCPRTILFGLDQSTRLYVSEGASIFDLAISVSTAISVTNCVIIIGVGFILFYKTFARISKERTMVLNLFLHIPRATIVILLANVREAIQRGITTHDQVTSSGKKGKYFDPSELQAQFDSFNMAHGNTDGVDIGAAKSPVEKRGAQQRRKSMTSHSTSHARSASQPHSLNSSRDSSGIRRRHHLGEKEMDMIEMEELAEREERRQQLRFLKLNARNMRRARYFAMIIGGVLIAAIAGAIGMTIYDLSSVNNMSDVLETRSRVRTLSRIARQNSDFLTAECRHMVQFGDLGRYENYWDLIHSGEREAVQDELKLLGISPVEQELLGESKSASDALIRTETVAMVLAMWSFDIDPARMVEVAGFDWDVKSELSDLDNYKRNLHRYPRHQGLRYTSRKNDSTLPKQLQRDIARGILYDSSYDFNKQRIMEPTLEPFSEALTSRYAEIIDNETSMTRLRKGIGIGLAVFALLSLCALMGLMMRTAASSSAFEKTFSSRTFRLGAFLSALFVACGLIACVASQSISFRWSRETHTRYDLKDRQMALAFTAAANSDFLTDEVRRFSAVGDVTGYVRYWELIHSGRREAVQDDLVALGITAEEEALIAESKANSDALINTETVAMALLQKAFNLPPELMSVALNGFTYRNPDPSVTPNATCVQDSLNLVDDADAYCYVSSEYDSNFPSLVLHTIARAILFNKQYEADKVIIMEPLARFRDLMSRRLQDNIDAAQSGERVNLYIAVVALSAALVFAAVLTVHTVRAMIQATNEYSEERDRTLGHDVQVIRLPLLRQLSIRYVAALSVVFVIVVAVLIIVVVSFQSGRGIPSTLRVAGERNSLAKKTHFLARTLSLTPGRSRGIERELSQTIDRMEDLRRFLQFGVPEEHIGNMYEDAGQQEILTATPCFNLPDVCAADGISYHGLGDLYDDYIAAARLLLFQKQSNVPIGPDHPSLVYIQKAEPNHLTPGLLLSFKRIVSRQDAFKRNLITATRIVFAFSVLIIFAEYIFVFTAMLRSLRAEESRTKAMMGLIPEEVVNQVEVIREYLRPE